MSSDDQITVSATGVLRLLDHVCGTCCQSIYRCVTVLNSLNGCSRPICLVFGTATLCDTLVRSAVYKSSYLYACIMTVARGVVYKGYMDSLHRYFFVKRTCSCMLYNRHCHTQTVLNIFQNIVASKMPMNVRICSRNLYLVLSLTIIDNVGRDTRNENVRLRQWMELQFFNDSVVDTMACCVYSCVGLSYDCRMNTYQ